MYHSLTDVGSILCRCFKPEYKTQLIIVDNYIKVSNLETVVATILIITILLAYNEKLTKQQICGHCRIWRPHHQ